MPEPMRAAPIIRASLVIGSHRVAGDAIDQVMLALIRKDEISREEAGAIFPDLVNRALANASVIDHIRTRGHGLMLQYAADRAIQRASASVKIILDNAGVPNRGDSNAGLYRSAGALRPSDAMAEISRRSTEDAAGRQLGADGRSGSAGSDRTQPAQPRLPGVEETDEERSLMIMTATVLIGRSVFGIAHSAPFSWRLSSLRLDTPR